MDMKKFLAFITAFILVVSLVGCSQNQNNPSNNNEKNNSNETNNGNKTQNNKNDNENEKRATQTLKIEDYYPIKMDTHYIYQGKGNEYASYDVYIDYATEGKVQQRVDNGGTVMANVIELKNGKVTKLYSRPEAYYRENLLKSKSGEEEILLMEPLEKGTTWKLKDSRVRSITGVSVQITTPAGNYNTIEVTTESSNDKTIDYYAKNVGLVKSVFIPGEANGGEISSSLSKVEENTPFVQNINFYYPNIDDNKIYYKAKNLQFRTNDLTKKVLETVFKESVNDLGPVFSENAKINSLYLNKDNHVYIDLNQAFLTEMNAGSGYEAMILQSIVNTVGQYYQAEKVYLTIDNKLYESGHIAMKKGEFFTVNLEDAVEIH